MFTGLVEELGTVRAIARGQKSVRLTINANTVLDQTKLGDSIAVNGTCLTVVELANGWFAADVMPETVDRTALANLRPGDYVNLERTLRVGDRLGGHIVAGHIDEVGRIAVKEKNDIAILIKITADAEIMRYIIKKGSIAIDGISLTVVDCGDQWFTVSLIPHTASLTTLGHKKKGDPVNLEVDMIGKYVEKLLGLPQNQSETGKPVGITMEYLKDHGF